MSETMNFWVFDFMVNNGSQTKFVAIIKVLLVFFIAIFRLTDFSSDSFDLSSHKWNKQVASRGP